MSSSSGEDGNDATPKDPDVEEPAMAEADPDVPTKITRGIKK